MTGFLKSLLVDDLNLGNYVCNHIFQMLVDMKDAGSKLSSAVDTKTPTAPQLKTPTVPQIPEDVPRAQADSPTPSAVHFDTRRMSADAHGAAAVCPGRSHVVVLLSAWK